MLAKLKSHRLYEFSLLNEIYGFIKPHIETARRITEETHQHLINDIELLKNEREEYTYTHMDNVEFYKFYYNIYLVETISNYLNSSDDLILCKFIVSHLNYQEKNIFIVLQNNKNYESYLKWYIHFNGINLRHSNFQL